MKFLYKILLILWCGLISFNAQAEPDFKGNFSGTFAGASFGMEFLKFQANNQLFRDRNPSAGFTLGTGITSDLYYIGVEGAVFARSRKMGKPDESLRPNTSYQGNLRLGKILRNNFLPYMGIGMGSEKYTYQGIVPKTGITLATITPNIGVDAFVTKKFMIRSAIKYIIGTSLHKSNTSLETGKKPRRFALEVGIFYKF